MVYAPAPPPTASIDAGFMKVIISEDTSWITIAKLISTIIVTYLGLKLINKYVK